MKLHSLIWIVGLATAIRAAAGEIELTLRSRDPDTGQAVLTQEKLDPTRVGVIAVDVWNYHWCKTATMRVDAIVPRINKALEAARTLGMVVMLCPSDVVDNYVGFPQREAVFALPKVTVPTVMTVTCPPVPDAGGCACGRERCAVNYGWDGMHPGLRMGEKDWMPDTQAEVYAICQKYHLTHLIYVGFHTQVCLLGKPMGLKAMKSAGLRCVLARDMTDAHPGYDPARRFTPDLNTTQVVEHFEKYLAPSISFQDELAKVGHWDPECVLDPVRITPWGTPMRPHLFEEPITVTLAAPLQPDSEIRYTLDGTAPNRQSALYTSPLVLTNTTHLRVTAFRGDRAACVESDGYFARMDPVPPHPDVYLGELMPLRSTGFGHTYGSAVRYSGNTQPPQRDRSNLGQELRVGRAVFARGLGVHAPCGLLYELKPEYRRFVGLAGADENLVRVSNGSNLAKYPSVVFCVYLDGREAARSPVMRVLSPAWRFNVEIPPGARVISLAAMDAGDGSREDFADWVNAGFTVEPRRSSLRDASKGIFTIGVGLNDRISERPRDWPLLLEQFSAVTPENCLKPNPVQTREGSFNFVQADAFVSFACSNQLQVVGHCLVWAKDDRTPPWFYRDGTNAASRALLLERMKTHIETVVGRYRGRIGAWDVVNEALDDGTNYLRVSGWSQACGEEFIAKAFEIAHVADPQALLIYNDYNNELPDKRAKLIRLVRSLRNRNVPIHAVGMQGHYEIDRLPLKEIEATLEAMRELGVKVVVSELDMDVIPRGRWWADGGKYRDELSKLNPYRDGCPPDMLQRQAEQYAQLFGLLRKYSDVLARVSFWNLHDGQSWLNYFPWPRANHPLLFDREKQPKPAFEAVCRTLTE